MTTLTIVNVDHVLHVGNVGKGDKVDKLIFLTTKISTKLTNKVDKLIFFNYISAVCTEWIAACTQAW